MMKNKIALIGCGHIGEFHLKHFIELGEQVDVVGFCDVLPERAQGFTEQYGKGRAYSDFRKMLDETRPDMLFVGVPPTQHGDIEFEAIARGIHLFIQKPLTLDMDLARQICRDSQAAGLITACGFQCRYSALVKPNQEFITEHPILYVNCNRMGGIPREPWWIDFALSGGQIVEQTIHQFDIIRYMLGEPKQVCTFAARGFITDVPGYDTDDLSSTVVRFESGALATIGTGCYAKSGAAFDSKITFSARDARADLRILKDFVVYDSADGPMTGAAVQESVDAGLLCDKEFIDAVISGDAGKIRSPYADALRSLAFTMACNESARTGKVIDIHLD